MAIAIYAHRDWWVLDSLDVDCAKHCPYVFFGPLCVRLVNDEHKIAGEDDHDEISERNLFHVVNADFRFQGCQAY